MSPASQGVLEVERYIGSCLISSNIRQGVQKSSIVGGKKQEAVRGKARSCYPTQNINYTNSSGNVEQCQVQYGPGSWAGTPLISMTSSPRKCNHRSSPSLGQQQVHQHACEQQQLQQTPSHQQKSSPLSRLAVHTQGAPLILAGRFHSRGKPQNNTCGSGNSSCGSQSTANINGTNHLQSNGNVAPPNTLARCPSTKSSRSVDSAKKANNPKADTPSNKEASSGTNVANIDSLSIASDESSNNSENSLPRIIKPRKRRKKDRKPTTNVAVTVDSSKQDDQQQQHQQQVNLPVAEQSNTAAMRNYLPSSGYEQKYEFNVSNHRRPPIGGLGRESVYGYKAPSSSSAHEIAVVRSQRYMHRHVPVKVLDDNRNVVLPSLRFLQQPKGYRATLHQHNRVNCVNHHHNNNNNAVRYSNDYSDTACCEDNSKDNYGSCQTHYCGPPGQIWDVDQNSYSPFLNRSCHNTSNNVFCGGRFSQMPMFLSQSALGCQEQFVDRLFEQMEEQQPRIQQRDIAGCGTILRRSWSDPTSYFSEEISAPSKDVGVIGDRGQPETNKRRTLWRGDTLDASLNAINGLTVASGNNPQSPPQGIEVSTEIVTSPNGHRDLEIKFYSPSPNAPTLEDDKSLFEEEELAEEGEDSSDIWSYHESKLQQDFRTLLQAEE